MEQSLSTFNLKIFRERNFSQKKEKSFLYGEIISKIKNWNFLVKMTLPQQKILEKELSNINRKLASTHFRKQKARNIQLLFVKNYSVFVYYDALAEIFDWIKSATLPKEKFQFFPSLFENSNFQMKKIVEKFLSFSFFIPKLRLPQVSFSLLRSVLLFVLGIWKLVF